MRRSRRAGLLAVLLLVLLAGGGIAVARSAPTLRAGGPTSVSGTEATGVLAIADRTVRQVRYDDGDTLRYSFELTNDGRLPVTVTGLAAEQPPSRLFTYTGLTDAAGRSTVRLSRRVDAGDARPADGWLRDALGAPGRSSPRSPSAPSAPGCPRAWPTP